MKHIEIAGISIFIFALVGIIGFNVGFDIGSLWFLYFAALGFAVATFGLVWWFTRHENKENDDEAIKITTKLYDIINNNPKVNLQFRLGKPKRIATKKTYEGLPNPFRAFIFEQNPPEKDVVIMWECIANSIADIDTSPSPMRMNDPYVGFNPYEGKWRTPPRRTEIRQETVRGEVEDEIIGSTKKEEM